LVWRLFPHHHRVD